MLQFAFCTVTYATVRCAIHLFFQADPGSRRTLLDSFRPEISNASLPSADVSQSTPHRVMLTRQRMIPRRSGVRYGFTADVAALPNCDPERRHCTTAPRRSSRPPVFRAVTVMTVLVALVRFESHGVRATSAPHARTRSKSQRQSSVQSPPSHLENDYSPALQGFVTAFTSASPSARVAEGVAHCVSQSIPPGHAISRDPSGWLPGVSREAFVVDILNKRYSDLLSFAECLCVNNLPSDSFMLEAGGRMLFLALSQFGTAPQPFALIDAILANRPSLDFTLDGRKDGYNLVHKLLDRHKFVLADAAGRLLRVENETVPVFYRDFMSRLAGTVSSLAPPRSPAAARVKEAGVRLSQPDVKDKVGASLGRTLHSADVVTLTDVMVASLVQHTFPLLEAAKAPRGKPSQHQPTLLQLLAGRDIFGRTPLHIVVQSSPSSIPLITPYIVAGIANATQVAQGGSTNAERTAELATRLLFVTDIFGYTPRELAIALNRDTAASCLQDSEVDVLEAMVAAGMAPLTPLELSTNQDDSTCGPSSVAGVTSVGDVDMVQVAAVQGLLPASSTSTTNTSRSSSGSSIGGTVIHSHIPSHLRAALAVANQLAFSHNVEVGKRAEKLRRRFFRVGFGSVPNASVASVPPAVPLLDGPLADPSSNTHPDSKSGSESGTHSGSEDSIKRNPDGGWSTPLAPSASALEAIEAATRQGAASQDCDFDVLDLSQGVSDEEHLLTWFTYNYVVPSRPIVLRGLALNNPLRSLWSVASLLTRHGSADFEIGEIPYVSVPTVTLACPVVLVTVPHIPGTAGSCAHDNKGAPAQWIPNVFLTTCTSGTVFAHVITEWYACILSPHCRHQTLLSMCAEPCRLPHLGMLVRVSA